MHNDLLLCIRFRFMYTAIYEHGDVNTSSLTSPPPHPPYTHPDKDTHASWQLINVIHSRPMVLTVHVNTTEQFDLTSVQPEGQGTWTFCISTLWSGWIRGACNKFIWDNLLNALLSVFHILLRKLSWWLIRSTNDRSHPLFSLTLACNKYGQALCGSVILN